MVFKALRVQSHGSRSHDRAESSHKAMAKENFWDKRTVAVVVVVVVVVVVA